MSTAREIRVVSFADPALDWDGMCEDPGKVLKIITKYTETRDESLLRFQPGQEPTWYTLRMLDATVFDFVRSAGSEYDQYRRAFQHACTRIDNLHGMDGRFRARIKPDGRRSVGPLEVPHLTDEQLHVVPPQHIEEMGGIAWTRSFLDPRLAATFRPPRFFKLVLETKLAQDVAALAAKSRELTSEARRAGASTPKPGAEATDAPATASAKTRSTSRSARAGKPLKPRKRSSKRSKS